MLGYLIIALGITKIVYIVVGVKDINKLSKPIYTYTRFIISTWAKLSMLIFGISYKEIVKDIDDSKYTKVKRANI